MPETNDLQKLDDEMRAELMGKVVSETREIIDHLNLCLIQIDQDLQDEALIDTITRGFHTIKGSSSFVGLTQLTAIAKAFEMCMRQVKSGALSLTPTAVNLMYEGLDAIGVIIDKAEENDFSPLEDQPLLAKIEKFKSGEAIEATRTANGTHCPSAEMDELLKIYRDGYQQLSALKHLIFSSMHLHDPESLAVVLSKQIQEHIGTTRNSLWLVDPEQQIVETAGNGNLIALADRRIFKRTDSDILQRILNEQLIFWPVEGSIFQLILPEYESPVVFPIKMKTTVLGLLILDLKEQSEIELFQFITQFAAMMLHICRLHQKVTEQHQALDEMTGLVFKQNAHLSALHHLELKLVQENEPKKLCQLVADALVFDLDTVRAAAFLYHAARREFLCAAQSGGFSDIAGERFPLHQIGALQQVLETGRLVAHIDCGQPLQIGSSRLDTWIAISIKGRRTIHGVMVIEIGEEEFSEAISIITHFLGVMLDNLPQMEEMR